MAFGKGDFGKGLHLKTELTNGECPLCKNPTILISIMNNVYRCMTCGGDTEQKVNGVIKFMPLVPKGGKLPTMKVSVDPSDVT